MTTKDLSKILFIPRGDYFPIYISVEEADGTAISLVGKSVMFQVKIKLNDPDETPIINKIVSAHLNAAQGETLIELTPTDTEITESGIFQAEFQVISGTNPTTFERCGVQFLQDVV